MCVTEKKDLFRLKQQEEEEEESPACAHGTHRSHPGLVYSNNETSNPEKRTSLLKSDHTNKLKRVSEFHARRSCKYPRLILGFKNFI